MANEKTIIYLHRYPIEYESKLCPATRSIIDLLLKKYNVIYLSFKPVGERDKKLRKGLIIKELPYTVDRKNAKDKWLKTFLWYLYMPKIKKFIKEQNASLIVHKEQLPLIPSFLGRLRIPLLLDIGDWWWTTLLCKYNAEWFSETLEDFEIRDWNRTKNIFLTTHSNAEKNMIAKRGMDPNRITVINHPSSKTTFRPVDASDLKEKLNFDEKDWVIAIHGITHASKDYGKLLKWWARISRQHKDWKLLNIGGTTGEKWYRNEIKRLKIQDSAVITGWIDDPNFLNKYLNVADCLLVTRKNNLANQGLIPSSLWHSTSIGKPLIVTGLPGLTEYIKNGVNGYSYTPDNYGSFKSLLEYLYIHQAEAKHIGRGGIKIGEKLFSPKSCAEKFFRIIDEKAQKGANLPNRDLLNPRVR